MPAFWRRKEQPARNPHPDDIAARIAKLDDADLAWLEEET
jgi:hypothetical protein